MLEMSETPLEWVLDNHVDLFIYFYMNKSSIILNQNFGIYLHFRVYLYQNTELLPSATEKED
jgi:hypothetical protein